MNNRSMRLLFLAALFLRASRLLAQLPDTDIFLLDLNKENGAYHAGKPVNLTNRKGYDNQPCFSKDGKTMLYISIVDTTESDVYVVDLRTGKSRQLTSTKESEYSPGWTPDGKYYSVVRVDRDSGQRMYRLPVNDVSKAELIRGSDSIGYYCWLNDTLAALFILGPSPTLQVLNTRTGDRKLIASDIGRCLKLNQKDGRLYFVIKGNDSEWFIYALDPSSLKTERVCKTLSGSEDFGILPDGTILMGQEGKLYFNSLTGGKAWQLLSDLLKDTGPFYRISVRPDGKQIAVVGYIGKKP